MLAKITSRKFLVSLAGFVAVNVVPALPAKWQAGLSAVIVGVYAVAEAYVDAHRAAGA